MARTIATAFVLLTCAAPLATAQTAPPVRAGTFVWVTSASGAEQRGVVDSISANDLVLRTDGRTVTLALADVQRIEGRDSLRNGMLIGGITGAAALGGFGLLLSQALCEIPDGCLAGDADNILLLAGAGAGAGIAAGALIDRVIPGRRLLYASAPTSVAIHVSPGLRLEGIGARVTLAWGGGRR